MDGRRACLLVNQLARLVRTSGWRETARVRLVQLTVSRQALVLSNVAACPASIAIQTTRKRSVALVSSHSDHFHSRLYRPTLVHVKAVYVNLIV